MNNKERYEQWLSDLKISIANTPILFGFNIELKDDSYLIVSPKDDKLSISATSFKDCFSAMTTSNISWSDSIKMGTNRCRDFIEDWINFINKR